MTSATSVRRGGLWRHRDFRLLWTGESISQVGTAVTFVVLPLIAIDALNASTFVIAALSASIWAPWLVLGLPAGAWIDRLPRRPVMLICDAVACLALASVPIAAWIGVLTIGQLIAAALVVGGTAVLFNTAYTTYLPSLVDGNDLAEANAKLTGSRSLAQVAGPGLGGVIAQAFSAATGLLADAISFAISLTCLALIGHREPQRSSHSATRRHLAREVTQGLVFVWKDPFLRAQLVFGALANLALTAQEALVVVFLVRTNHLEPGVAGVLLVSGSVGGIVGAVLARRLGRRWGTCRAVVVAVTVGLPWALLMPLAIPGVGLVFFVVAELAVGTGVVASNILTATFRQTYVPAAMLGRVTACVLTFSYSCMPVGALLAGGLGQALGVRTTLWIISGMIAASALIYLTPVMRRTREFPTNQATANSPAI